MTSNSNILPLKRLRYFSIFICFYVLIFTFSFYVCERFFVHLSLCSTFVIGNWRARKNVHYVELELQTVMCCLMESRNQTQVFCKTSECPSWLSHLSIPILSLKYICIYSLRTPYMYLIYSDPLYHQLFFNVLTIEYRA